MNEPKPLTEAELEIIAEDALMPVREMGLPCEMSCDDAERVFAMARLALTLQKRAEEAEAMVRVLADRLEAAELVLDLVHEIRDGGGALEPQLREHFDRWLDAESKRVGEAFANLRNQKR